ncbi:putative ABC transport system permease protein [Kordia periserrulae]|uniref:Putative ABC transport system permease protein n=1 Tax=Kordia periserrulae TaxID=701523 RepID=A0A2T6C6A8_9FLAO|nr:ABC transporter permease [Kordia periserrulae]PTX63827.1 putative ABC transport system permease protein [Kordia periserrulae]
MFDLDRWREIFQTINKNKLRTLLAGFTVTLGILIFTILFGMGNGLKNTFYESFQDDAQNTIFISPRSTSKPFKGFKENRRIEFENEDLEFLKEKFADRLEHITARVFKGVSAKYKNEYGSYDVRAVHPSHQYLEQTETFKGRYINQNDIRTDARVAVIGRLVEKDLFGDKDAVGEYFSMNKIVYRVIGVFKDEGSGDREERTIYTPVSTTQRIYKNTERIDQINLMYDMSIGANGARKLSKEIEKELKKRHNIAPSDRSALRINNKIEDLEETLQFASLLQIIVIVIGIGTLLAGVIGISNIMVYIVKERTKELGIRKALGAKPSSVIGMILQETVVITLLFGYIGLVIGNFILNSMGDKLKDWFITNPNVSQGTIIGATIILVISGLIAGYIPARRAAKVKPIVALRDE